MLQAKRCTKRSCATWIVVALTFGLSVILAIQVSLTYLYGWSPGSLFETVLWFFFRVILPLMALVLTVIIIREACRSSSNTDEATEDQRDQTLEDPPPNTAVPAAMIVALALIYLTLDAIPTMFYAILYLVPDKEWCVKSSRPTLDALDTAHAIVNVLGPVVFAYKFLVYFVAGRKFRTALRGTRCTCACARLCCKGSVADLCEACVEVAQTAAGDD